MIEQNTTNIDRYITKDSVYAGWEYSNLYASETTRSIVAYAYKPLPSDNIRYDNFYETSQNTWQSISNLQSGKLQNVFTSSINNFNKSALLGIYTNQAHTPSSYLELFQIGYGNMNGSGSLYGNQIVNIYGNLEYVQKQETKTLYGNIKKLFTNDSLLLLEDAQIKDFVFITPKSQYLADGIMPESLELHVAKLDTSTFPIIDIEGPAYPFVFVDKKIEGTDIGYVLSGSIETGIFKSQTGFEFKVGYIHYPTGTIIFDTTKLVVYMGFSRGTTQVKANEDWKLPEQMFLAIHSAIKGNISQYNPVSGIINPPVNQTFALKSINKINYVIYQCELEKSEFNYSNNITYRDKNTNTFKIKKFVSSSAYEDNLFTASNGQLYSSSNASPYQNPEAFITTIGLYSDTYDLIAVAKLSKPIRKNYDKKIIINIRLDF